MRNETYYPNSFGTRMSALQLNMPRKTVIGVIMIIALLAFEIFNFDTTKYALSSLLGDVRFLGLPWASILAIAFCSIDFAGLIHLFTPERVTQEKREVYYLMGAWLLGATMNAIMTWWAVSLTLLNQQFGNEVLNRDQLLLYVPIFVAVLVWLTRILFIGGFTIAGDQIFDFSGQNRQKTAAPAARSKRTAQRAAPARRRQPARSTRSRPAPKPVMSTAPAPQQEVMQPISQIQKRPSQPQRSQNSRIRQRPPMPKGTPRRVNPSGVHNRPNGRH